MQEDSCGVPLVLRDGFGGFLPQRLTSGEDHEEGFEFESAGDGLIDFGELAGGEPLPTGADGSVVAETVEEKLDFGKAEAHFGGEANEQDAVNGVAWIAALAAETLGRSEE